MGQSVSSRVLHGVAYLIESQGHDAADIAATVGLAVDALYRPDLLVNELTVNDLYQEAALALKDPFFSLRVARLQSGEILGPIWLLMQNAKTVGESMQLLCDKLETHAAAMSAYLVHDSTGASIHFEIRSSNLGVINKMPMHGEYNQVMNLSLAICCDVLRNFMGGNWAPRYVQFRNSAPNVVTPLQKVFGDKLFFNQDVNAIHLNHQDCDSALHVSPSNDESIAASVDANYVDYDLPFTLQVDKIIRSLINHDQCAVEAVALALGIKRRTLQHRLKQYGTSYQELYDSVRIDLAKRYLKSSSLSMAAISERLGFKDSAVFSRFFKNKVGHTARAYAKKFR